MFQTLRIIFTILSALCVAVVLPVGAFAGLTYALIFVALAFVFFVVMLFFKNKQEELETERTTEKPDFITNSTDSATSNDAVESENQTKTDE